MFENGRLVIWDCLNKRIIKTYPFDSSDKCVFAKYHLVSDRLVVISESGSIEGVEGISQLSSNGTVSHCEISKDFLFLIDTLGILNIISIINGDIARSITESELQISENTSCSMYISSHFETNVLGIVSKNRIIRIVDFDPSTKNVTIKFKLLDAVNKWPWRHVGFSHHSETDSMLTFGTAIAKGKHLVYLWDNLTGSLVHTLEGPKEEISTIIWHPNKPQLVTIGAQTGHIFIWGPVFPQKWAALVPNIEAIETNIEYIEREDEFDLPIEEEIKLNRDRDEATLIEFSDFKSKQCYRDDDYSIFYPLS